MGEKWKGRIEEGLWWIGEGRVKKMAEEERRREEQEKERRNENGRGESGRIEIEREKETF